MLHAHTIYTLKTLIKDKINYYQCLKRILTEAGFEANVKANIIGSIAEQCTIKHRMYSQIRI